MDIGEIQREIDLQPIYDPVPREEPVPAPEETPVESPAEKPEEVPA
jgi:hypothetical protein